MPDYCAVCDLPVDHQDGWLVGWEGDTCIWQHEACVNESTSYVEQDSIGKYLFIFHFSIIKYYKP